MAGINLQTIILLLLPLSLAQHTNEIPKENSTVTPTTTAEPTPILYEYIIKLVFGLENEKVPEFLLETIFSNSANITTQDVISLYNLETLNLSSSINSVEKLGYRPYKILSIDGLEAFLADFSVSFTDFYNTALIKNLNITGAPLRKFLINLGINAAEFADAISYGEGDPFQVFKRGNFSNVYIEGALQDLGKTKEDLFVACRDVVLSTITQITTDELFNILKKYNFDIVEAMELWEILELDVENAENITAFANLLEELKFNLENASYLGILTSKQVAINKDVYESIKDKIKISKLFAQSVYDNTTVEVKAEKPYYENIVTLRLENDSFTSFIEVATSTKDLEHCEFLTMENDTIVSQNVEKVINKKDSLEVNIVALNLTDVIPGSPLMCNNKVYGLAKEIEEDKVVFDTFLVHSGVTKLVLNPLCIIYLVTYLIL